MKKTKLISKESIISKENEILDAIRNSDLEKLDELMHKDLLFNTPSGQTITKDLDLENYRLGKMKVEDISSSEQSIRLIEDTAVVTVTIDMKGKYLEHSLDGKYQFIRVWKVCGHTWKVIAGSSIKL